MHANSNGAMRAIFSAVQYLCAFSVHVPPSGEAEGLRCLTHSSPAALPTTRAWSKTAEMASLYPLLLFKILYAASHASVRPTADEASVSARVGDVSDSDDEIVPHQPRRPPTGARRRPKTRPRRAPREPRTRRRAEVCR